MYPTTDQQQLFESVLRPLLVYANRHLGTVTSLQPADTRPDEELRLELVARALWQHLELIDDYVRDNPDHLECSQLDIVRDLRGALYDDFVFEGISDEGAVFVHDTGTYLAASLSHADLARYCIEPFIVRTALVPFMGRIAVVAPFCAIGIASKDHREKLRGDARRRGYASPTSSASDLARRSRAWQEHKRKKRQEIDAPTRPAGPGYHRGTLAGLSEHERERIRKARYDLAAHESGVHRQLMELHAIEADNPPLTLAEALDLLDSDWLESIAEEVLDQRIARGMAREDLISLICRRVTGDDDQRDLALMWCEDAQFELVRRLVHESTLSLTDMPPSEAVNVYPMIPYVFILQEHERFVAWMPPEVRPLIKRADLEAIGTARKRLARVANAASALASLCGVITLDDAYDRYRDVEENPLDREHFESALMELEVCDQRDSYALWDHDKTTYLISGDLSDQSALARVVRKNYAARMAKVPFSLSPNPNMTMFSIDDTDEDEMRALLDEEMTQTVALRLKLIEAHRKTPAHALAPAMLETSFVDYLMGTEPLRRIRDYVDEHMPDDEDDFEFAETFARGVIISILFEHESYDEALDLIRLFGMTECEGDRYPHTLGKLITDVFNTLPVWPLNGWSLAENTERLTGKPFKMQG